MRMSFRGPELFSGDEDDDADADADGNNDGGYVSTHRSTSSPAWEESRLIRVKSRYLGFGSPWPARICSMICCLLLVLFIAVVTSFLYVILKDLRAERVTAEDGTEVRLLGFWSMLVLSSLAGVLCCSFSWTLTYFDSFEPGVSPTTPLSSAKFRQMTGHSFHMGYSMAILNGIVAGLTFFWCLI